MAGRRGTLRCSKTAHRRAVRVARAAPVGVGGCQLGDVVSQVHPRVGGETRSKVVELLGLRGSIPAWAGKPRSRWRLTRVAGVHPRVGGETRCPACRGAAVDGPSPRGRGNHYALSLPTYASGSIPAWAGKPARRRSGGRRGRVHPRVGGETVAQRRVHQHRPGPSPRGRGNHVWSGPSPAYRRSIPAWAGKPLPWRQAFRGFQVHPRVGGETAWLDAMEAETWGPSPRGRGNPRRVVAHRGGHG